MTKDEALKLALVALEKVTTEMLALKDELAERGARPTTNVFHQRLWDSSFKAYTDHALPAATAIREALTQPEQDEKFCDANCVWTDHHPDCKLAQPEEQRSCDKQEPVAMRYDFDGYGWKYIDSGSGSDWQTRIKDAEPIYTTPPQRKPLSNQKIIEMYNEPRSDAEMIEFARAIEAAHGIWPENSDCYGPDWTDRDGEYLK